MKTKVLIAEDDERAREVLRLILEEAGYEVCEACDGVEALWVLERTRCNVILTDFHMPHLDGLQLLGSIRRLWPQTRVIIVSGDPIELAGTALKQGAYAWIHKPFQAGCLLEIVGKATEQYSEMQQ